MVVDRAIRNPEKPQRTVKAIIFDLDGLLIDTEPIWQDAEIAVFGKIGVPLTREMTLQTTGMREDLVVDYWQERFPWKGLSKKEVLKQIEDQVAKLIKEGGTPKPGVEHVIDVAKKSGLPLGLASSGSYQAINASLERLQLQNIFKTVHSAEDEKAGKPEPDVYLTTARMLGVEPEYCLALEDSVRGVKSAKAAGMKCIAVPDLRFNTVDEYDGLADVTFTNLNQISLDLIRSF